MTFKTIEFETTGPVGLIRINRPDSLNALNAQVITDLKALVVGLRARADLRACVLTGAGTKAFVAGADIKEMDGLTPARAREMAIAGQALMQHIEDLPFPVIAALNGFALGGGFELALACDFIVAAETAKWGLPEVTLGLIPGYGGTQRLVRNIGRARARRVALSGELFTARQGYEWGVITDVTPVGEAVPMARALAETLAGRAPRSLAWVKEAINHGSDRELAAGLELEAELFGRTFETLDHREGIRAFVEKRRPEFKGT